MAADGFVQSNFPVKATELEKASGNGSKGSSYYSVFFRERRAHCKKKPEASEKTAVMARRVYGVLAQLARASALQAECQGFESLRLHQTPDFRVYRDTSGERAAGTDGRIAQLVRARP